MNQHPHDQTLYKVAAEILESLALMFLVPEDEAPQPSPPCDRQVGVAFSGPLEGLLVVAASSSVLPELAANMLGVEVNIASTPEQQEDALKEFANVVCGNLLPTIAGREPVFHIDAPKVLAHDLPAECCHLLKAGQARLLADAGVIECVLLVSESATVSR